MDHKYKTLLINIPLLHIIKKVKTSTPDLMEQLTWLEEMNMRNYFILGK